MVTFDRVALQAAAKEKARVQQVTLHEVEKKLHIGRFSIVRLHQNEPRASTAAALCVWLGISMDSFVRKGKR